MNIFKKIWNWIFGSQKLKVPSSKYQVPSPKEQPSEPLIPLPVEEKKRIQESVTRVEKKKEDSFFPPIIKKWRMKNNRLHIVYNGKSIKMAGKIESLRVTSYKRAEEIISRVDKYVLAKAYFQDRTGKQFKIYS